MTRIRIEKGTGGWGGPLNSTSSRAKRSSISPPAPRPAIVDSHRQPDRLAGGGRF